MPAKLTKPPTREPARLRLEWVGDQARYAGMTAQTTYSMMHGFSWTVTGHGQVVSTLAHYADARAARRGCERALRRLWFALAPEHYTCPQCGAAVCLYHDQVWLFVKGHKLDKRGAK